MYLRPGTQPLVAGAIRAASLAALGLAAVLVPPAGAAFIQALQFGTSATLSVAWADAENDGDLDLAVGNTFNQGNELYVNMGGGAFVRQVPFGNNNTFAVLWGDYDEDGDLDMAVGNGFNQQNRLFVNNGNGTFTGQNQFGLLSTVSIAWADYDLDGDLDLAVGNGILGANQQNFLYINNGNGTFIGQPLFGLFQTDSLVWGDIDADGDPDLAVGNGGFGQPQPNFLFINNGDGTFMEVQLFGMGDTSCVAWGDYDNDADLDLAVANWNAGTSYIYRNDGDYIFIEQILFTNHDPNTLAWGDADLDGDLDLAVGNGDFNIAEQNYLYVNNGNGTFTETPEFGLGSTDGVAWGDYDADGDLDLAVGNEHSPTQNYLYVNDANNSGLLGWLALKLVGHHYNIGAGYSNRDGVGAKVFVYEDGFLGDPAHLLGFRVLEAHGGFSSQGPIEAHFGLPGRMTVDVRIVWPGSAGGHIVQDVLDVATRQRHVIHEAGFIVGIAELSDAPNVPITLSVVPNPVTEESCTIIAEGRRQGVGATAVVRIHDAIGRLVRVMPLAPAGGAALQAVWDRRGADGRREPSGVYFVHDGTGASTRLILVR